MKNNRTLSFSIKLLFVASVFALITCTAAFFINLNSTLTDYSWGDIGCIHQYMYNYSHGRPYQTSMYWFGPPNGVSKNPYSYLHQYVIHTSFAPVLIGNIYRFFPGLSTLYALVLLFNYGGVALFSFLILKHLGKDDTRIKWMLAFSLFVFSFFSEVIYYKAHESLYVGPLILAAYLCLLKKRPWLYVLVSALICVFRPDGSLFLATFSLYLFLFEPGFRKNSYSSGLIAIAYFLSVTFIVSPAVRAGMTSSSGSQIIYRFQHFSDHFINYRLMTFVSRELIHFALAFVIVLIVFKGASNVKWKKIAGLIFIAPLSHWFGIPLVGTGFQNFVPIIFCVYLAFLIMLSELQFSGKISALNMTALSFIVLIYVGTGAIHFKNTVGGIPLEAKYSVLKKLGKGATGKTGEFHDYQLSVIRSNRDVIKEIKKIPADANFAYWTNMGVEAFITDKSDLWRFPYNYDIADYLVIQKNMSFSFYYFKPSRDIGVKESIKNTGTVMSSGPFDSMKSPAEMMDSGNFVVNELVEKQKTHRIYFTDDNMIILARIHHVKFEVPERTMGYYWLKNVL